MSKVSTLWQRVLTAGLSLTLMLIIAVGFLFAYLESQMPDVATLKDVQLSTPLRIYSSDGKLIEEYGEMRRVPVPYEKIPKMLINAVLATEDQRFFEHPGVDILGLARAGVQLVRTGTKSQGGSTITMQVARNFFLTRKKTYLRKFNEILLAIKIDKELSKEKILELYLNTIYFGNRAYGVAAASHAYYGKHLSKLTVSEMAMLAGLPQAPSAQNPLANPVAAKKRRGHVLERMYVAGMIDKETYAKALEEPIHTRYHGRKIAVYAPYVAEMIRQALFDHFGRDAYTKGYKVYTTIDSKAQKDTNKALENALLAYDERHGYRGATANIGIPDVANFNDWLKQLKQYPMVNDLIPAVVIDVSTKSVMAILENGKNIEIPFSSMQWARPALNEGYVGKSPQKPSDIVKSGDVIYVRNLPDNSWKLAQLPEVEGALVSLSPKDGAIISLTGGFNFYKSNFNRVTQATRQPGSSFKPFIYAAALAKGLTLATVINDAPVVIEDPSQDGLWRPQNSTKKFYGPTRLRVGLIWSRNLVSIRVLEAVGIRYAVNYAKNFGFDPQKLPHTLSLALGSLNVSPLELSAAYAVFANGGYRVEPYIINKITDSEGRLILQAKPKLACTACITGSNSPIPKEQQAPQTITPQISYLMTSALKDVIQHGTGSAAKDLQRSDIAGKTGTTNEQKDAWFAGYNSDIVTIAWVGFDRPQSLHEYGAAAALPMWMDFMREFLKDKPDNSLPQPEGIITISIDPKTGQQVKNTQPNAISEVFQVNNPPNEENSETAETQTPESNNSPSVDSSQIF